MGCGAAVPGVALLRAGEGAGWCRCTATVLVRCRRRALPEVPVLPSQLLSGPLSPNESFLRYLVLPHDSELAIDLRQTAVVVMAHLDRLAAPCMPPPCSSPTSHKVCPRALVPCRGATLDSRCLWCWESWRRASGSTLPFRPFKKICLYWFQRARGREEERNIRDERGSRVAARPTLGSESTPGPGP